MPRPSLPSNIIYRVTELLVVERLRIVEIVDRVNREFPNASLTRETVYPLIGKAVELGFLRLVPPVAQTLARELEKKYHCPSGSVRVVDCPMPGSNESVSAAAAALAIDLLRDLQSRVNGTVGLGLGPGRATRDFAKAFSQLLSENLRLAKLNLVAISAGGPARHPENSAISFFNLFRRDNVEQRIGLFAETLVHNSQLQEIRTRPAVREAFEAKEAGQIHMVVTSMGDMDDPHSLCRIFYAESNAMPNAVKKAIGDVQYRPFTAKGFIKEGPDDLRAVTLYELDELVQLATQRDRVVILIARQCGACVEPPRSRARTLRPLLQNKAMRVFSHLVTDTPTARDLLDDASGGVQASE